MPRRHIHRSYSHAALLLPLLAVAGLVGISPFFAALGGSFFHDRFGEISPAGVENYRFILSDRAFFYSLNITVLWAFLQTILGVSLGTLIAWRLWFSRRGRKKRPGGLLHGAILIPWAVPVYIAVPIWRAVIHGDGEPFNLLIEPVPAFLFSLMVSTWMSLPAMIFLIRAGLKKIGGSSIEAALLEGAGEGQIALLICLPQLKELLLSSGLITFVKSLKEFTLLFLMTAGGPPLLSGFTERHIVGATSTLSMFLYELFISAEDYGVSSAFSVLFALVVITASILYLGRRRGGREGNISGESGRRLDLLLLLPPVVQLLSGGNAALPVALLYLLPFLLHRGLGVVALLHSLVMVYLLGRYGFPAGLQPALAVALLILLSRLRDRKRIVAAAGFLWRPLGKLFSLGMIGASGLMLLALVWLSISGVNAVAFRSILPPHPGLGSFRSIFLTESVHRYFLNSLMLASATALLIPVISAPAAWAIASGSRKRGNMILGGIQLAGTVSGMHALIPLYIIFRFLGLINSYLALILIYLEHSFIFSLFSISAFLRNLPRSLREAALIEGAGAFTWLRMVLLPLSRPVIVTAMMVAFLGAWNGFLPALLFIRDDWKYTIGVKLYTFVGSLASGSPRWSLFAATSMVNMAILLILFLLLGRAGERSELSEMDEE